jgi:hypothetical protein
LRTRRPEIKHHDHRVSRTAGPPSTRTTPSNLQLRRTPEWTRREAREETGLDVEPVALTGVYKSMAHGTIALVFWCKITGGDLRASDETTAFRWANATDVGELADQTYAVRILDALNDEHPPAIREHDGVHLL